MVVSEIRKRLLEFALENLVAELVLLHVGQVGVFFLEILRGEVDFYFC